MEQAALPLQSLLGIVTIPFLAWAISENRAAMASGRGLGFVLGGIAFQFLLVGLLLYMPWTRTLFELLANGVLALQAATDQGAKMVFGYLAGGPAPFKAEHPSASFILAFRVLPLMLVLSAIVRLLYHWGILQRVVQMAAWALQRTFGTGGPLATSAAASIILGMIEAPLLIKPYLKEMPRGALFAAMTVGMATVAGTVMALYASILSSVVPGAAGHLIVASVINVPGALVLARLAVPDGFSGGPDSADIEIEDAPTSSMDAIAKGTFDGLQLVAAVAATLIVMVSLVALVNSMLGLLGDVGGGKITLQLILGYLCVPFAFIIGIPLNETIVAGGLIGQKVVLNEFLAYLDLLKVPAGALSERSKLLLTYALCGFANLGSLGILIGGLSVMCPERRAEIVELAPRSLITGFLATLLTASIIGTTVWP
jgi:concentrative nucleoside transporter, CNT family